MVNLERGFKSWSERCAVSLRRELGIKPSDPLSVQALAGYLEIELLTPKDVPGLPTECLDQLLKKDRDGWSALTILQDRHHTIIYNPRHSVGRQSSDIMHELAHIIMEHEPSKLILSPDGSVIMRTFDQKQEDEAAWLSGCLLLPRETLLHIRRSGASEHVICQQYRVAPTMLKYRIQKTGVDRQLRFTQIRRTSPGKKVSSSAGTG